MANGVGWPEDRPGEGDAGAAPEVGRADALAGPSAPEPPVPVGAPDGRGASAGASEPGWWHVRPVREPVGEPSGGEPPAPRSRRRYRGAARTVAVGLVGALLGAVGVTMAVPAYRAAAQGYPVITTVPVTASQQASGAPAVQVYQHLKSSIVLVTNQAAVQSYYGTQSQVDWGSGVVLTSTGYIVTNAHVVVGSQKVTVTLANGKSYPAHLVGDDPSTDLAVIKISPPSPLQPATFANSSDVTPGELAVAIGNPLGPEFAQSVTEGIVSAIRPMLYGGINGTTPRVTEMIQTDAPINPGNSGGALANAQGEVIGITSMKVGQTGEANLPAIGLGFAIPSNTVKQIVDQLIRLGYVPRAWMGVAINTRPANALPTQPQTLTVAQVNSGSPAAAAGIQAGDVLTSWQGKTITNYWDLVGDINAASPGQKVVLGLTRNGRSLSVTITLGTMPRSLETQPSSSTAPAPSGSSPAPSGTTPGNGGSPYPYPFPFPFPLPPGYGSSGGH